MDNDTRKCRIFIAAVLAAVAVTAALLYGYSVYRLSVKKTDISEYNEALPGFDYKIEGGSVYRDGHAVVTGWLTDTGRVDSGYNYGVDTVLYGVYNNFHCGIVKDNEVIIFPTRLKKRPDVNNESGDGIDYKYCGFNAYVPDKYASGYSDRELVLTVIRYNEEQFIIKTGITLGEIIR